VHTSNYYTSPEYRAYFSRGPYFEPSQYYGNQRYTSPATRPYTPNCEPLENTDPPAEGDVYHEDHDISSRVAQLKHESGVNAEQIRHMAEEGAQLIDRGWALLDSGDSADAMPVFAKAAMLRCDDVEPRIGYAIAATIEQHDMIAAWAFRRGVLTDANALVEIELTDHVSQLLRDALARVQNFDVADDVEDVELQRDRAVITSVLALLLDDAQALDVALAQLAALDEPKTMQALITASKTRVTTLSKPVSDDSVAVAK
jgi:hypothetical protein